MTSVAFLVHAILSNVSNRRTSVGHTLVGLLPVRCTLEALEEAKSVENEKMSAYGFTALITEPIKSGAGVTADPDGRERRMKILHKAM